MFYYKVGDIHTTTPWGRPTKSRFNKWLLEWSELKGVKQYQVYLTGAFCQKYFLDEKISTWDIDLILMGDTTNYPELKNILDKAVEIGFKYRLLIDAFWRDHLPENNVWSQEKIITYTTILKKTPDEYTAYSVSGNIQELIPGLYKVKHSNKNAMSKFKTKNYNLPYKKLEL